jgi:rod shape-determining protein MreD
MHSIRLAVLTVLCVVVQVSVFPHARLFGVVPDLGLMLAVAVAFRLGPEAGALVGFAAGLGFDLFLASPVGMSALAYALTAYLVGVLQTGLLRAPAWVPPLLGFVTGLAGGTMFAAIGLLAGVDAVSTWSVFPVIALAAVYDALLAPFVFMLVGRLVAREPNPASGRLL